MDYGFRVYLLIFFTKYEKLIQRFYVKGLRMNNGQKASQSEN